MPSRCASKSVATEAAQSIKAPAGRSTGRRTEISFNMLDRFLVGRALNWVNYARLRLRLFDLSHGDAASVGCNHGLKPGAKVGRREWAAAFRTANGCSVPSPNWGCGLSCRLNAAWTEMTRGCGDLVGGIARNRAPRVAERGERLRLRRMDERPRRGFGIPGHFDVDQIGAAMRQRLFQRGAESLRRRHARRADAEGFREFDKIRIDEVGRHHAALEALALVAPHISIRIVVEHQRDHADVELYGGGEFLHAEHEALS